MRMVDLILKKRNGGHLTKKEIDFIIDSYVKNLIPDYQVSALLMAIVFQDMSKEETFYLTEAMLHSGEVLDLSQIKGVKVDKHSTGGVGDKVSLILGPLVVACGAKMAKMSGRGLGHTGGTIDKMESIPGMRTSLSDEEFINQVNKIGLAIIGQSAELDPADKKLYALRDVTGTVDAIPLIASSIMSKKLASGSDTILLDVKFGEGAFMKTVEKAKKLASLMVEIGKYFKKDTRAEISNMNSPLGRAVGNILEIKEVIQTLKGNGPSDLVEIITSSGATILQQAKIENDYNKAKEMIENKIKSLEGFKVFREFVKAQGGDLSYIDNPEKFKKSKYVIDVVSPVNGYVSNLDALEIGVAAMKLGAGREKVGDSIDFSAGIYLHKKTYEPVKKGDVLASLYTDKENVQDVVKKVEKAYSFSKEEVEKEPLIYAKIA